MVENKRYQLRQEDLDYPIYSDLVDTEDNDKVICTFNNDSQINKMIVLLNEQDKKIKDKNQQLENVKYVLNYYKKVISYLEIGLCTTEKLRLIEQILNELGWDSE